MSKRRAVSSDRSASTPSKRTTETRPGSDVEQTNSSDGARKKVRWGSHMDEEEQVGEESIFEDAVDGPEKICLAASCSGGRVGCAYYDPVKCVVYVLEDTQEGAHFDLSRMLLEQTSPDIVLTSTQADDEFMDVCRNFGSLCFVSVDICAYVDYT
ncbi:hypothetical protein OF83DRAFT_795341 [Amylostereum chailletii]|nr:hypothetical protein OF83DRAFT_795341 [Amylostereum chailletii]